MVRPRLRRDVGMVTAELAVGIPAVVLVLAICLAGLSAGVAQIRCVDAARLAARAAARGDSPVEVEALARLAAPEGATVSVGASGGQVRVVVSARAGALGGLIPAWTLTSSATTPVEGAR